LVIAIVTWTGSPAPARDSSDVLALPIIGYNDPNYSALATRSIGLLEHSYNNGLGLWRMCVPYTCNAKNRDWGADALTNVLAFRWMLDRDPSVLPYLRRLVKTSYQWSPHLAGSSDSAAWDAVSEARMYQVTGDQLALKKSEAALAWITSTKSFATGACPQVDYQWAHGKRTDLKTIETEANYVKAAMIVYSITGKRDYLKQAEQQYAVVRKYFLARTAPLYTAYMFDNHKSCHVLPGQFFASVNGDMIWDGSALAAATGQRAYLSQAIATARAVQTKLSDSAGVFADLLADNDIVEPLIEAMYTLATTDHQHFARQWLLTNASAAGADVNSMGEFGRFFDGPPPADEATAWQVNGGIALAVVAATLDPHGHPSDPGFWQTASFVVDSQTLAGGAIRIQVHGRAIAIIGTIGAQCCNAGHARVFVDGRETFDQTGIWQNMSSPSHQQPDQVLFAWRWRTGGEHVITIRPASYNSMQGGSFFQMTGYLVAP
jgi:hypothetical protein